MDESVTKLRGVVKDTGEGYEMTPPIECRLTQTGGEVETLLSTVLKSQRESQHDEGKIDGSFFLFFSFFFSLTIFIYLFIPFIHLFHAFFHSFNCSISFVFTNNNLGAIID